MKYDFVGYDLLRVGRGESCKQPKKHGISFDDAEQAFYDPYALMEQDRFVDGEERWLTIGLVDGMIVVAHTRDEYGQDEVVRIISARRADRRERKRYGEHRSKSVG